MLEIRVKIESVLFPFFREHKARRTRLLVTKEAGPIKSSTFLRGH